MARALCRTARTPPSLTPLVQEWMILTSWPRTWPSAYITLLSLQSIKTWRFGPTLSNRSCTCALWRLTKTHSMLRKMAFNATIPICWSPWFPGLPLDGSCSSTKAEGYFYSTRSANANDSGGFVFQFYNFTGVIRLHGKVVEMYFGRPRRSTHK
jgi:hypothetical protein